MVIRTCQAKNLVDLMAKVRSDFGLNATVMSVRQVGQVLEATVAYENQAPEPPKPEKVSGASRIAAFIRQPRQRPEAVPASSEPKHLANSVIALVGPMGSGKTTTAAKIAGRLAKQTNLPVGLLSTDTDRPGGSALLMGYAANLGLQATTCASASDLHNRLSRWNCRGPLVIDTRGCGPRDTLAIERLGGLLDSMKQKIDRYLVLSATEHPSVARECLRNFEDTKYSGVILTRVDQAAGIGHCLEEVNERNQKLVYLGTGEAVPDDLMLPSANALQALKPSRRLTAV